MEIEYIKSFNNKKKKKDFYGVFIDVSDIIHICVHYYILITFENYEHLENLITMYITSLFLYIQV